MRYMLLVLNLVWVTNACASGSSGEAEEALRLGSLVKEAADAEIQAKQMVWGLSEEKFALLLEAMEGRGKFAGAMVDMSQDARNMLHKMLRERKDTGLAVSDNFETFVEGLSELTRKTLRGARGLTWLNSELPHPMYSYAYAGKPVLEEDFKLVMESFKLTPFYFCLGTEANTQESRAVLEKAGLVSCGGMDGMFFDLSQALPESKMAVECTISTIENAREYKLFAIVMAKAAGLDPKFGLEFFKNYEWFDESPFIALLACVEGKPVGCSMLLTSEDRIVAGHYFDWVLPEFRGKGIGSAMVVERLKIAKECRYKFAVAQCMTTSTRLYGKLGFKKACDMGLYTNHKG